MEQKTTTFCRAVNAECRFQGGSKKTHVKIGRTILKFTTDDNTPATVAQNAIEEKRKCTTAGVHCWPKAPWKPKINVEKRTLRIVEELKN
jgi:hypothetical protein